MRVLELTCAEHAALYTPDPPKCLPAGAPMPTVPADVAVALADTGTSTPWLALVVGAVIVVCAGLLLLAAAMGGMVRALVTWTAFVICGLSMAITFFVTQRADGVTVIGGLAFAVWVWGIGAHRRAWWFPDDPAAAASYERTDHELDASLPDSKR